MGNRIIHVKDILTVEKLPFYSCYYRILLRDGTSCSTFIIDDLPLLRLENFLHLPYSRVVSDKVKAQVSQDNKNSLPIELSEITIVFREPGNTQDQKKRLHSSVREIYVRDIIAYHKLLVHRGSFESLITKVLENKEEIYTQEFQDKFNNERDRFLEILKKKTGAFNSKL